MIEEGAATLSRVKVESLAAVGIACAVLPYAFIGAASSEVAMEWGQSSGYMVPDGFHLSTNTSVPVSGTSPPMRHPYDFDNDQSWSSSAPGHNYKR
jgi:hypothetical protein